MLAAVYKEFLGKIAVETVPVPVPENDGVVVEVRATGVCRSDWHGWCGHDGDVIAHGLPFVPGHELSGVIIEASAPPS
jgi:alcohol dehydrogenase